jgi:hypothetical protein
MASKGVRVRRAAILERNYFGGNQLNSTTGRIVGFSEID